jgi:hypothetical protein
MIDRSGNEYRELLAELTAVIADRTREASHDSIALRDAVCAYVAVEHERGTPLKSVVETVKQILRKAEKGTAGAPRHLAQQLVDWCHEFHPGGANEKSPIRTLAS